MAWMAWGKWTGDGSSGLNVDGNVDTIGHGPTNTKTLLASPTQQCQMRLQQKEIFHGSIKCTIRLSYIKIPLATASTNYHQPWRLREISLVVASTN
mmetsp:Transcript_5795/g.10403  ORF Transcript_5795/g.10403 Transcript_5795/m.10403 type:complete len:96 (+) Transcript_5795:118-405(+)